MRSKAIASLVSLAAIFGSAQALEPRGSLLPPSSEPTPPAEVLLPPSPETSLEPSETLPLPGTIPPGTLPPSGSYFTPEPTGGCTACGLFHSCGFHFSMGYSMDLAPGRVYGGAEYLLWWLRDDKAPPLLTTGPTAGVLGQEGTVILAGGTENGFDHDPHHGVRAWVGGRIGAFSAVEAGWLMLDHRSDIQRFASDGSPGSQVLSQPIFIEGVGETIDLLAFPGLLAGELAARQSTELWGGELNYAFQFFDAYAYRYEFITGFRFLAMDEALRIDTQRRLLTGAPLTLHSTDVFSTNNRFYGWQLGIRGVGKSGPVSFAARGTIALGGTHREVEVDGSRSFTDAGGNTTLLPFGFYAQNTNIGKTKSDQFDIVPEVSIKFGYDITPNVTATIGYTFIYWGNVFRPGSQIDRTFDGDRPTRLAPDRDFWAQGINFGLEVNW